MLSKISRFFVIASLTTLTSVIANPSEAKPVNTTESQEVEIPESNSPLNMNELINRAFSENSGTFYEASGIAGQLNTILGWRNFPQGSFPENNITQDGLLLHTIMSDYFKQLQQREPIIRTRDFPNPFDSSLNDDPNFTR
ncbi:hypothetical protein [Geminocystis sp. GBBB08]|uniref:hypothetical protein n=1 Tax=Geminocystis sp. GBBB08 TaxID=2604140 RepID=UPI0027E3ABCC|nr:hypothetical protein [Geminocystis sp. GBBB08]MBL1210873.1 hypothetical protein [Geminocystis sp. GBBB08]